MDFIDRQSNRRLGAGVQTIQMIRIGISATQIGMNQKQLDRLRDGLRYLAGLFGIAEVHHGDCIGGDLQFDRLCVALTVISKVVIHPPQDSKKRAFCGIKHKYPPDIEVVYRDPLPYLDRNKGIVLESDYMFIGPSSNQEELRSGTWSTYRFAYKLGRPHDILER